MQSIRTIAVVLLAGCFASCANVGTQLQQAVRGVSNRTFSRPAYEPPSPPVSTEVGSGIPGLIVAPVDTNGITIPSTYIPKEFNWGAQKAQPPECRADMFSKLGYPAEFNTEAISAFWAARARLINLETRPEVWSQITDVKASAYAASKYIESAIRLKTFWETNTDKTAIFAPYKDIWNKTIDAYNKNLAGPDAYIRAAQRLARNQEVWDALYQYLKAESLAIEYFTAKIRNTSSHKNIARKTGEYYAVWRTINAHCNSVLLSEHLEVGLGTIASVIRTPVPKSFPTSAILQLIGLEKEVKGRNFMHHTSAREIIAYFGELKPIALPLSKNKYAPLWAGIHELFTAHEVAITRQIEGMSKEEFHLFRPVDETPRPTAYLEAFYSDLLKFSYISKALDRWQLKSKGLIEDNSDNRTLAEKSRVNAAPSRDDLTTLVTNHVMRDSAKGSGSYRRVGSDKIEYEVGGYKGQLTVSILTDSCTVAANGHRCKFTTFVSVQDKGFFAPRTYGSTPTNLNILVKWGQYSLVSPDLEKIDMGLSYRRQSRGGSSSSSSRDGEDLVDVFVNRDQDNRQNYYDQSPDKLRQSYDPSKKY